MIRIESKTQRYRAGLPPAIHQTKSFTLNSNHEMYSGANGYYYEALAAPLYVAQNKASYFAIYYQDWAILGLDSAFYSESFFCMEGALQDAQHAEQVAWVQKLDLTGKKVIALRSEERKEG